MVKRNKTGLPNALTKIGNSGNLQDALSSEKLWHSHYFSIDGRSSVHMRNRPLLMKNHIHQHQTVGRALFNVLPLLYNDTEFTHRLSYRFDQERMNGNEISRRDGGNL